MYYYILSLEYQCLLAPTHNARLDIPQGGSVGSAPVLNVVSTDPRFVGEDFLQVAARAGGVTPTKNSVDSIPQREVAVTMGCGFE